MGYKQKSGILQRAGYDKDATSPFPQKTDSTSGDKLPSYNVTTYDASASASGGGSSSSSNSSNSNSLTSSKTNFSSDPVEKAKQQQWIKNNPKKYKQMLAEKKNATQQPAANEATANNASSNRGQSNQENIDTETITLGDQTLNQIKKGGSYLAENRQQRALAIRENARAQAVKDSSDVANAYLDKLPVSDQLSEKAQNVAQLKGNWAAARTLAKDKVYKGSEIKKMVLGGQNYLGQE